jgi:lipopolysaccharide export system protein LptC
MNRSRHVFPALLLAALASLTFWLDRSLRMEPGAAGAERNDPDLIVEAIVARRFDAEGRIKHTLHASRMSHYPRTDTTLLEAPRFISDASGRAPVTITSRTARVERGGEEIHFEDNVRVSRAAFADRSELVMETDYLQVLPDAHIARTDRKVTITDAHTVATAIGLELNSEQRTARFLSQFRGTYHDPERTQKRP